MDRNRNVQVLIFKSTYRLTYASYSVKKDLITIVILRSLKEKNDIRVYNYMDGEELLKGRTKILAA